MVKVVELSKREIEERELNSKLVDLAKQHFPPADKFKVIDVTVGIVVSHHEKSAVHITYRGRNISVKDPYYLEKAVKLAEDYEKLNRVEVVVKKDYSISKQF